MQRYCEVSVSAVVAIFLALAGSGYAQDSSQVTGNSFLRFFYNKPPDSLFLNDRLITSAEGELFAAEPGVYTIEAVLDCHYRITRQAEVKPHQIRPVGLNFKHFTSAQRNLRRWSIFSDVLTFPGGIVTSILSKRSRQYVLPLTLSAVAMQIVWQVQEGRNFHPCNWEFTPLNMERHLFSVGLSVESFFNSLQTSSADQASYRRVGPGFDFSINVDRAISATFIPKLFATNYGATLEFQKYISPRVGLSGTLRYLPDTELRVTVNERLQSSGEQFREYETSVSRQMWVADLSAELAAIKILNQELLLMVGGYVGNTLKIDQDLLVGAVSPPSYSGQQDTIRISYQVKNSGFTLGLGLHSPLSRKLSFIYQYRLFSKSRLEIMGDKQNRVLQTFRAGFRYHL